MNGMSSHLDAHDNAAPMAMGPTGPLQGLRIIDVTHALAGPYAGMFLADLGADVIKVEPPTGEMTRHLGPWMRDDEDRVDSGNYAIRNRNKRSICLDLTTDADRETFLQLVETADGLVENMRSGVLDALGVGWEVCHARNPRLVYAAIRGFGDPRNAPSPYASWPAYDLIAQAMGGVIAATGQDEEHVMKVGPPIGDTVPGLMATVGLLAALYRARETGEGQFLDVAMVDAMMSISEASQMTYSFMGRPMKPMGNGIDGTSPYDVYPTQDGHCVIATPTEPHWRLLCELIGREDLLTDERTALNWNRVRNKEFVDECIGGWAASHTTAEVAEVPGNVVPAGPVYSPVDWVDDPHVAAREMLVRIDHPDHRPMVALNCPIKFSSDPAGIYQGAPALDQHGDDIRAELSERRQG
jgi:crotonobetainyl-CoA:carnitine CoA-transferase CaiB-like acyl-CoA transferase